MKKPLPVALICAGKLTDGAPHPVRALPGRLGPVMSTSRRLASRVVKHASRRLSGERLRRV